MLNKTFNPTMKNIGLNVKEKLDDLVLEYEDIHKERLQLEKSNREFLKAKELIETII